ncbi:MAG: ABC transporter permease subunit [Sarcina sp.]
MKELNKYLYDNLDREYERKNLYLLDIAVLKEKIKESDKEEKARLKKDLDTLVKNKSEHSYNKKFLEFKNKEKVFLKELEEKMNFFSRESSSINKNVKVLERRLKRAKEKCEFYKKYIDLTYEAQLIYKQCEIEIQQIPVVLEFAKNAKVELDKAYFEKMQVSDTQDKKFLAEFNEYKEIKGKVKKEQIRDIKEKYKARLISVKARDEGIKTFKRKYKEKILTKSFEAKRKYNDEIIKTKKYELGKGLRQKINTVNINVADIRRTVPVEVDKTVPYISYLTCLLPGLGQLINGQFAKSTIMFLASIYIYLIEIPYALGFGNYKGDGIAGLITLAQGGKRLDRSIIFMVEGILAIFLLVIGLVLLILSFKDVNKTEKEKSKGVRVKSWCETKQSIFEDGFPYLVSMPALVIIVFIVFVPIAVAILLSFTGMDPNNQAKFGWEGLTNYTMLLTGEGMVGSIFWKILKWTIIWTIGATTLGILIGFGLALILNNDRIKGKAFFRSIYLLPWAVPAFITIIFFSILAAPNGAITQILQTVFGESFSIKNDAFVSKVFIICIQAWLGSSYVFLLSTGVLQSINNDLYEAADIDGATTFSKLTKITIPLVLFQTAPLLVGQYTFNFNNFSNIYLFNTGGPFNPVEYGNLAGETDILISYIYKLVIENQYQAVGAAVTVLISLSLMIIAYISFRQTSAFRKEK